MERLPAVGESVTLATELVVREDGWALYGFLDELGRRFFQRLIGVTGVGPKLAVSLVSALGVERGARAVQERNIALLASVSGIGKKTAERLALELADKVAEFVDAAAAPVSGAASAALQALERLGYARAEADRALGAVLAADGGGAGDAETLVRRALQLLTAIDAAKQRREPLDHALFFGPPGLGKTTLALLMAKELGVNIRTTSGPVLERPGDLVGMLTSLQAGDILFIDEVHRLRPALEEFLYPAMEDYRVDVRIADGAHAQTIPMALERFTLIGATTRFGLLTPPMRARFGLVERLSYYPPDDLAQIIGRSAGILDVPTDAAGIAEIARRSRGTPRVANRLLKRVRDY